mgnify:CR=1 FL=1
MALTGSLTELIYVNTGEYETVTVDIPADEPSDSEYYEYAGQQITQSVEIVNTTSSSLEGVYIKISSIQIWPPRIGQDNIVFIEPTYRIFGSEASRSADVNNYIRQGQDTLEWDTDTDTDPYQVAYDLIKASYPNDTLTDC